MILTSSAQIYAEMQEAEVATIDGTGTPNFEHFKNLAGMLLPYQEAYFYAQEQNNVSTYDCARFAVYFEQLTDRVTVAVAWKNFTSLLP